MKSSPRLRSGGPAIPPVQEGKALRVATYTRISTDEERQPYSLEAQAGRLRCYVASQDGWELTRTFTDQCSGATLERPALQQALREARLGRFDVLLVYRVDRLARSVRGLASILEALDNSGVGFRSATEPFDTSTSAGRMMVQMLGVFSEFERATIVDRVIAGMERKAASGCWASGSYPIGYTVDPATGFLLPRDDEAPLIPLIFERYAKGRLGARTIAEWLNNQGHHTRRGCPWSAKAVITVLRNRAYVGEIYFRDAWHPAPHPRLVDIDVFNTAQAILDERGENWSLRASNPSEYLLAGVVICDRCGKHYVGGTAHGRGGRYRYYTCWSRQRYGADHCDGDRLSAPDLEQAVIAAMDQIYAQDDVVQLAVNETRANVAAARPKYEDQLVQVDKEISKAETSIERYLAAFEANTIPETACGERVRGLADKVTSLRQRRNELICTIEDTPALSNEKIDLTEIRRNIADVIGSAGDRQTRKAFLQALIAEVRVESRENIIPRFRIPLQGVVRTVGRLEHQTIACSNYQTMRTRLETLARAM